MEPDTTGYNLYADSRLIDTLRGMNIPWSIMRPESLSSAFEQHVENRERFERQLNQATGTIEEQTGMTVALYAMAIIRMREAAAALGLNITPQEPHSCNGKFSGPDMMRMDEGYNVVLDRDGEVMTLDPDEEDDRTIYQAKPISAHAALRISGARLEAIAEFRKRFPAGHVFYGAHLPAACTLRDAVLDRITDEAYYWVMGYKRGEAPEGETL